MDTAEIIQNTIAAIDRARTSLLQGDVYAASAAILEVTNHLATIRAEDPPQHDIAATAKGLDPTIGVFRAPNVVCHGCRKPIEGSCTYTLALTSHTENRAWCNACVKRVHQKRTPAHSFYMTGDMLDHFAGLGSDTAKRLGPLFGIVRFYVQAYEAAPWEVFVWEYGKVNGFPLVILTPDEASRLMSTWLNK